MRSHVDSWASRALRRVGTSLCGRYRIERLVGVGGMGAVYAGRHRNGHQVAIKILHQRLSDNPEQERQFRREALLANSVNHPGVVPVIDDDVSEDGYVLLVMPLLVGETLRARAERFGRKLPVEEVVVVAHAVLGVLEAAHAAKIVHRDIKPENIFLTRTGDLRVLDFGVARFFETSDPASATRSGHAVGTPAFMAPEQALGRIRQVDGRTDLWALGATMFTLLSGQLLHEAETAGETLVLVATKPPRRIAELVPELPSRLGDVIDRALSIDRDLRWPDAATMDSALIAAYESSSRPLADLPPLALPDTTAGVGLAESHRPSALAFEGPSRGGWRSAATRTTSFGRVAANTEPLERRDVHSETTRAPIVSLASGSPQGASGRRRHLVALAALAFAATAASSGLIYRREHGSKHTTAMNESQPLDASTQALISLRDGERAWEDANPSRAEDFFRRALKLDANLASAHLWLALLDLWPAVGARAEYAAALAGRSRLLPEERELLEGIAPAMRIPADFRAASTALAATHARRPESLPIASALVANQLRVGDSLGAIRILDEVSLSHPASAVLLEQRGTALLGPDDPTDATSALRDCVRVSPLALSCYFSLVRLAQNEGRCDEALAWSRQATTMLPNDSTLSELLATSAYGRLGPIEAARPAVDRIRLLAHDSEKSSYLIPIAESVLAGDFSNARRALEIWEKSLTLARDESDQERPTRLKLYLSLELSKPDEVRATAEAFLAHRTAWIPNVYFDYSIVARGAEYKAGVLNRSAFLRERNSWLEREAARPQLTSDVGLRWILAYAETVVTPEDAREAIAALPRFLPLPDPLERDPTSDDAIGFTYLQSGDLPNALRYLRRAANACDALDLPFEHTWSNLHLGQALERAGDATSACEAYAVVVARWGGGPSESATISREARRRLGCP